MPYCKRCGDYFKYRQIVEGKEKLVFGRIHCLSCVPFGKKGKTSVVEGTENNEVECICTMCGKPYQFRKRSGCTLSMCRNCTCKVARDKRKLECVNYMGGKCIICGYNKYMGALEFHHVDPTNKVFQISSSSRIRWEKLIPELDKCVLLCSNCHREVESGIVEIPDS